MTNSFKVSYDQSIGLRKLVELAVGEQNVGNINSDITQERFSLARTGARKLNVRVEPYLNGETSEHAAIRLTAAGHVLANIWDLASFLREHLTEAEKWYWVVAISEDSRWTDSDGDVFVPCVYVARSYRSFGLRRLCGRLHLGDGVLVIC